MKLFVITLMFLVVSANLLAIEISDSGALIIGVFPDKLMTLVDNRIAPSKNESIFNRDGVASQYSYRDSGRKLELRIKIYSSTHAAKHGTFEGDGFLAVPPKVIYNKAERTCRYIGSKLYFREKNVTLTFKVNRLNIKHSDLSMEVKKLGLKVLDVLKANQSAFVFGKVVDIPMIKFLKVQKTKNEKVAKLLLDIPTKKGQLIFTIHHPSIKFSKRANGFFNIFVDLEKNDYGHNPDHIFISKSTGEITSFHISNLENVEVLEPKEASLQEEQIKVEKTMKNVLNSKMKDREESLAILTLSRSATEEMKEFFCKILDSDRNSVSKKYALRGLLQSTKENLPVLLRKYIRNRKQPLIIRRNAVRALGMYGKSEDISYCQKLLKNKKLEQELRSAVERTIKALKNRK